MNGVEHYDEAERLLAMGVADSEARALVHATLALAAATAMAAVAPSVSMPWTASQWRGRILSHPPKDD